MALEYIYSLIWAESFWLPKGMTWDFFEKTEPGIYYPRMKDLLPQSLALGVVLLFVRYVLERIVFIPFGKHVGGIKPKKFKKVDDNSVLEESYKFKRTKIPTQETLLTLTKKTNLSERYIQRWYRDTYWNDTPGVMHKFCEVTWSFSFYGVIFWYGLWVMWDKPWFRETKYYWKGWPSTPVSDDIYWYYLIESGFYWSLIFTLLNDVKRKDFKIMVTHHVVTLWLMYTSWATNFVRVGSTVLILHDVADSWGMGAKMAQYCKKMRMCEIMFGIFILIWIISRIFVLSYITIYSCWFEVPLYLEQTPFTVCVRCMLHFLQLLHVMWTYMLLSTAYQKLVYGELRKDERSDTEEELEDEISECSKSNGKYLNNNQNNHT